MKTSQTMLMHLTRMSRFICTHSLPGAGIDRLPFQVCPRFFYYITLREKCQTIVFNKKALDKQGVLAYNKDRKSIPVDGLLPLLELRFNRRELVAGAVISFSCRGDSDYYFYDYSKCTRSR